MHEVEQMLNEESEGVLLLGCEDCYYRYGRNLAVARINRKRPPGLAKKLSRDRIQLITTNHYSAKAIREFTDSLASAKPNDGKATIKVLDYFKTNHIAAALILCAFFLLMPFFSNTKLSFFDKDEKLLVLNFKYISSPTEFQEQNTNQQRQMQSLKPIVKRRSPIMVEVAGSDGNILLKKEFSPRGLRKDISIFCL
ncbi:MAG: hypothetical protein IPJ93_04880 [Bacteroidota bacterium]|nr:MAG: hypothetical protein IPJ93_04880 [Bacteroidota bacterium]